MPDSRWDATGRKCMQRWQSSLSLKHGGSFAKVLSAADIIDDLLREERAWRGFTRIDSCQLKVTRRFANGRGMGSQAHFGWLLCFSMHFCRHRLQQVQKFNPSSTGDML